MSGNMRKDPPAMYCVMRIDDEVIRYMGLSLYDAAVALKPGTVYGSAPIRMLTDHFIEVARQMARRQARAWANFQRLQQQRLAAEA